MVVQVSQRRELGQVKDEDANANEWSSDAPAELEPTSWVVSNHVLNAVIETVHPETPRNGDALEEDEPKENQIAAGVAVEKLENVHAALSDAGETDEKGNEANYSNENLFTPAQQTGPFVYHSRYKALQCAKLGIQAQCDEHQKEKTRPQGRPRQL